MTRWSHRYARRRGHWGGGGFWGGWGRFFAPGEVRLVLLSLLSEGPKHGYELMRELEARSGGMYRASAGTVYPTLQQLEDEGLVTSTSEGGKRVYRLTPEGERELEAEEDAVRDIWDRVEQWGDWGCAHQPEAAELWGPAMRLVKAVFRAVARSGRSPVRVDRIREVLERAQREVDELRDEG